MSPGCTQQGSKKQHCQSQIHRHLHFSPSPPVASFLVSSNPIVLASPSYLIGHPLSPICDSNENRTPALPTFAPLRKSLPQQQGEKDGEEKRRREKGSEVKESGREPLSEEGVLCYCWPGRLDCQMAGRGKKKWSLSFGGCYDRGLEKMMI